jgi:ribosomal protein S18 acetylase RimI-like enzyme
MAISVRRAVFADAAAIAAVHAAARIVGYRDFVSEELLQRTFSADLAAIWEERLGADEPPVVLVAVRAGALVGYCMLLLPSDDEDSRGVVAELTRMSVMPEAWGSGVGTALMDETVDLLRREGWEAMSLWVLKGNSRALAFYSGFGFEPDGAEMTDPWSGQTEVRLRLLLADAGAAGRPMRLPSADGRLERSPQTGPLISPISDTGARLAT